MLAVLPRLMSPLVAALGASDALATLGLRTMEYWVDSLNPEFLEPAMAPVVPALMRALWAHLRPLPYPFGAKVRRSSAMRTLSASFNSADPAESAAKISGLHEWLADSSGLGSHLLSLSDDSEGFKIISRVTV